MVARSVEQRAASRQLTILVSILLLLAGCGRERSAGLERIPTAQNPPQLQIASPTPSPAATDTPSGPTPIVTAQPALALPDETGASIACAENTLRVSLDVPPIAGEEDVPPVVSRIDATGDWLYVLANGGLYGLPIAQADAGIAEPVPVLLPNDSVAGRPVQELVDLYADADTRLVYALDKIGHIFRWEPVSGTAALSYRASPTQDEPQGLPFNLLAMTIDGAGQPLMLDAAHGAIVNPVGLDELGFLNEAEKLTEGADLTTAGGQILFTTMDGEIRTTTGSRGSETWRAGAAELALSLRTSGHLGIEQVVLVDGLRREVTTYDPATSRLLTRLIFDLPTMGLLRDAVFTNGRLYAAADDAITIFPGPASGRGDGQCEPPDEDEPPAPSLYGQNVLSMTAGFLYPIQGGTLPPFQRVYPGAARIYRMGVHRGVDIYRFNGPPGYGEGFPVVAMAEGRVVRASIAYDEMTDDQFNALLEQSEALGMTPTDILDRLEGRQVEIDHGNGIRTVYAHLANVAPGVVPSARVRAGQVIGSVGVTGTQAEGRPGTEPPHLHYEVWVGDRYLGYGLPLRETMWWFEQIFGPAINDE